MSRVKILEVSVNGDTVYTPVVDNVMLMDANDNALAYPTTLEAVDTAMRFIRETSN